MHYAVVAELWNGTSVLVNRFGTEKEAREDAQLWRLGSWRPPHLKAVRNFHVEQREGELV